MPPHPPSPSLPAVLLALGASLSFCACRVTYLGRAAWHQAELMALREPIDEVLESERHRARLSPDQARNLALIPEIKRFGEGLGLARSGNYETISARWEREISNFSVCDPLSLEPVGWWFPIVGRVPYLGFFRERDVQRWESRYRDRGYDVHVREVAAYSTLGWFRDPVLPAMLDWEEYRLAEVVLHELTHATLWVPGSVSFNETFANVVGEWSATQWMEQRYGESSPEVAAMWEQRQDKARWRAVLNDLYNDLDKLYKNSDLPAECRLEQKRILFESLPGRAEKAGFHDPDRYVQAAAEGPWNNARLAQYRTYNHSREAFDRLLEAREGDLKEFISDVRNATYKQKDPWSAIERTAQDGAPEPK
jgi:predicted aminopeptidase